MEIHDCLLIAGMAHRRVSELKSAIAKEPKAFPRGTDSVELSQEIQICTTMIAAARALLAWRLLELKFSRSGEARAQPPQMLKDTVYDNGVHCESKK
jgi:hypothetical protein